MSDAVLVGWGAYSLVADRARRVALLAGIAEHLTDGGVAVVSCFERDAAQRELRWTAAIANVIRRARSAPRAAVGDTLAPNHVHIFTRDELVGEAAEAGLDVVDHHVTAVADAGTNYAAAVLARR
jgi:hypothetical protein